MATQAPPREPAAAPDPVAHGPVQRRRHRAVLTLLAVLASLVALGSAAALPFAPVHHDRPVVTWPQDPAAPVSTSLMLVAHRPAALSATTTCATARAAAERGGVLLSTMRPESARSAQEGLLWWVTGGQLRLEVAGTLVDSAPLGDAECTLALVPSQDGTGLVLLRDGQPVGEPTEVLPEVDSLVTDVEAVDAAAGEQLGVQVAVNDEFASSPTPLKAALVAALLVSGVVALVCLGLLDRLPAGQLGRPGAGAGDGRAPPPPRWRATLRPRWADAAVVALVVAWTFLAPMTDDDGYYAAMARNVSASGYVGQYYQLYDQSFVPLTWPWYALSWWTGVADTPLGLRVPALVLGLLTWVGVRRCADLLLGHHGRWGTGTGVVRGRVTALLALAFATAWTPYDMGVRPEVLSAAGSALALTGVLTALRTGRRLPLALGVVAAALSCAAHPTGAVAVAPLVAATPALWRRLRADRPLATLARVLTVIAPGAMATAAGFADGTLRDFQRGREVFRAVEEPLTWTQEIRRYEFLLNSDIPMGAYAKRTAVLLALLGVALALLLAAAARARRVSDAVGAAALATTGSATLLAFVALWVTPSKWTHHFGSLAGLAPLLLTVLLLLGPDLARRALPGRGGGGAGVGVVAAVVAVAAVAMTGPNQWPYSWELGMPHPGVSPYLSVVRLASPLWWALGAAAVAAVLVQHQRRAARAAGREPAPPGGGAVRVGDDASTPGATAAAPSSPALRAAAVTVVVLMAVSTTYLVGSFAIATAATLGTYSPSAAMVTDPLNRDCGAAGAIRVADDGASAPLRPAAEAGLDVEDGAGARAEATPEGSFVEGGGWWQADPPAGEVGEGPLREVWGSLQVEEPTGELLTRWYALDGALSAPDAAVTVLTAGDLREAGGVSLAAEYGVVEDGRVRVVTVEPLQDDVATSEWRHLPLGDTPLPRPTEGPFARDADGDGVVEAVEEVEVRPAGAPLDEPGLVFDPELAATAQVVRLHAVDADPSGGGWLAVAAPTALSTTTMSGYLPDDAVVATAWQRTYLFPCQRQVVTGHGISTRPEYAVLFGARTLEGAGDSVWQPGRGGLYAQVPEQATMTQLASRFTDAPRVPWGQLARLDYDYVDGAYDVRLEPEVASGTRGPSTPPLTP